MRPFERSSGCLVLMIGHRFRYSSGEPVWYPAYLPVEPDKEITARNFTIYEDYVHSRSSASDRQCGYPWFSG